MEQERWRFKEDDSRSPMKTVLDASTASEHWSALKAVLDIEQQQKLYIIVDGLDKIELHKDESQKGEFIKELRLFITHLQDSIPEVKVILTSQPHDDIRALLDGVPSIEYNAERKGLAIPALTSRQVSTAFVGWSVCTLRSSACDMYVLQRYILHRLHRLLLFIFS
jgi:hypothetical protein